MNYRKDKGGNRQEHRKRTFDRQASNFRHNFARIRAMLYGKDAVQQRLILLRAATIFAPANVLEQTELISDGIGKTATWVFETDLNWDAYARSVRNNLTTYIVDVNGEKKLQFRRQLSGDVFTLDIEGTTAGRTEKIRITFRALPSLAR